MTQPLYCARHTKNETSIRCGRCEVAICPDCLVHSPVGMRCPDCARVNRVPTYDVPLPYLLRGIGAGAAAALALGFAFNFAAPILFRLVFLDIALVNTVLPFLYVAMMAGIGFVIGEAVSLSTNRKRGLKLKIVSAACVFVGSYAITIGFPSAAYGVMYLFIGLALATWLAIRPF